MKPAFPSAFAVLLALLLASGSPAAAQAPEPDCDPATWPASGVPDSVVLNWCADHPGNPCDLTILSWSPEGGRSPQIRFGDAISPTPERPRFFLDSAHNRFYTKLYSQFRNQSLSLAPAGQVFVDFFYKLGATPADPADPAGWLPIGSYPLNIPAPGTNVGPGAVHTQAQGTPVCWLLAPGALPPQKLTLKAVVRWPADDDTANNTAYSFYDLTTSARKAQISLAIDLSGSMAGTKLTQALEKSLLFSQLIEEGDQLGVYGFATDIPPAERDTFTATYTPVGGGSQTLTMSDVKVIVPMQTVASAPAPGLATILTQSAYNCTPVGQGLLRARKGFSEVTAPDGAQKAIVLFSDGLQNVPPFVNAMSSESCGSAALPPLLDAAHTFHDEGIRIYSIFWGPASGYGYDSMWQIQHETGGDFFLSTDSELGLAAAYYGLRGLVDDMIFFAEKETASPVSPAQLKVDFDAGVDLATVAVAWPYGDGRTQLRVDCRKLGESEWRDCAPRQETQRSFLVFRFHPGAETTWEFRVRQLSPQTGKTEFTAAVFSAVQDAALSPSLDSAGFETGKPLPIHAELSSRGAALTGAAVHATVRVPARAFSNTLRRYAGRFTQLSAGDTRAAAVAAQLQSFLLRDEGSDQIYTYRDVPVALRDDGQGPDRKAGDGIYSGELPSSATQVAGDYQVTIDASAALPSGRTIHRIAKLSAICNVGSPDPKRTAVNTVISPDRRDDDDVQFATVTLQWADRFGNAAFPGTAYQIAVTPVNAVLRGPLVDNLDSTFSQVVTYSLGSRPEIRVAVRGVPQGSFAVLPGQYRYEASFHLGAAVPQGTFSNLFSTGPSLGIDAALRLNSNIAVRVELVRDDFDRKASGSSTLVNLSAYLQYRWTGSLPWEPYFETGLGAYDLEGDGTAFGFAAGVGARRRLTPRWSLDLNLQGHQVGGALNLGFGRLRAGVIYGF
jgi:hypothetical protein